MLKNITDKIENLLEQKNSQVLLSEHTLTSAQKQFQPIYDNKLIENLAYAFSYEINSKNFEYFFSQLSTFFEIGFLMEKINITTEKNPDYRVKDAFFYQNKMIQNDSLRHIGLPQIPTHQVLKTSGYHFLKKLQLEQLDTQQKYNCYLIKITDKYYMSFLSPNAEPWIKLQIEALNTILLKINFNL